jgi:flagellin
LGVKININKFQCLSVNMPMSMSINTNMGALMASSAASSVNKMMETSMNRLSTGLRINTASDDAAGVAIASRLTSGIMGTNQAIRNAGDAQALIDTAEGAQAETANILQRMRELAVQAANDTNSSSDRVSLNDEVVQLTAELERIAQTTTWAGQKILDGSFVTKNFQIGADVGQTLTVSQKSMRPSEIGDFRFDTTAVAAVATATTATNTLTETGITVLGRLGSASAGVTAGDSAKSLAAAVNTDSSSTGVKASAHTAVRFALSGDPTTSTSFTLNGGGTATTISASVTDNADLSALLTAINTYSGTTGVTAEFDGSDKSKLILREADGDNITINNFTSQAGVAGATALSATIEKQSNYAGTSFTTGVTLTSDAGVATTALDSTVVTGVARLSSTASFTISDSATDATLGYTGTSASGSSTLSKVSDLSLTTRANAESAIGVIDTALGMVSESRASLGAVSNRIDATISNLTNISTNLEAGRSSIQDADFAAESTNLAKAQILQQASTAMLAQANASKQGVLQLLQG